MRRKLNLVSDRKAYHEGYEYAMNLAEDGRKINFKSTHPLKALVSRSYLASHIAGIRDGYRQGLRNSKKRKGNRLQELFFLTNSKTKNRER